MEKNGIAHNGKKKEKRGDSMTTYVFTVQVIEFANTEEEAREKAKVSLKNALLHEYFNAEKC